jgi:phosphoglycolate phosphatase
MPHNALLFDLDGTLVDSLPDLTTAINLLRTDFDLAPLSLSQVRNHVGDGATALVQRSLPENSFNQSKLATFLDYYQQHLCEQSSPYPGIGEILEQLGEYPLAVVTNKPQRMATELLDNLGLSSYFHLVLGGDSCAHKKPHPAPVFEALRQLNTESQNSLMIGDHHTDLRAAKAAGIPSCFCSWGYGNTGGETPAFSVSAVSELQQLLVTR